MRATVMHAAEDVRVEDVPDPEIEQPTDAVLRDGAGGLCGVIAAKRLGAERIIILGHHAERTDLAREFGATEVAPERGEEAVERVRGLTDGFGANSVLECVGSDQPTRTAIEIAPDILDGTIEPGRVFDRTVDLDGVPDGYRAMNERESLKVMVRP